MIVNIDTQSGFCFGVVSAITTAEKKLAQETDGLYCLGDIVHNNEEVERLHQLGLQVIDYNTFQHLKNTKVLIRAHGEPPKTYNIARKNNIELIDATCPIVLKLQERIKEGYAEMEKIGGQVLIYGKAGHAEVIGLNGQTGNNAIVISHFEELQQINYHIPIRLYSQTTMNTEDYTKIREFIRQKCEESGSSFQAVNSICGSMSSRAERLQSFAENHDALVFVSGKKSSNGQYLYSICRQHNANTFFISNVDELQEKDFKNSEGLLQYQKIGICGATSTPMWLMEAAAKTIENFDHAPNKSLHK